MNEYVKTLIDLNKDATAKIAILEDTIQNYKAVDQKTQVNYGNLCVALHGYRDVADATEAMLINENCVKTSKGDFYLKVDEDFQIAKEPTQEAATENNDNNPKPE